MLRLVAIGCVMGPASVENIHEFVRPAPHRPPSVLIGEARPDLLREEVLADIFARTCEARPGHLAFTSGDRSLTYGEADRLTGAMAQDLVARGIGPGQVVGLWMPRGIDLLLAQIAITRAGAAWLPFDADAPLDRIAVCLADCDAVAVITDAASAARASGTLGVPVLVAQDLAMEREDDTMLAAPASRGLTPDHPAYLIYTSGSTGTPKGIVITHRNICHFLRSGNEVYGLTGEDVVFQGASVAFDLSMEEIWIPYLVGATLVVATPAMMGDAETLPDLLSEAGVTVLDTVPTLLALLPRDIPSLRVILLGGEALPAPLVQRWWKPGRRIFNTYGPTEATVVATAAEVFPDRSVTIGRPIPNYTAYICDENLNIVGAGSEGELVIGGPGIARGYLKRPELTGEKFVANPFGDGSDDPVLYRSGDAVSLDSDGNILFHGRIDDQVKIRGFRVELGEIEAKLAEGEGVAQVAVALRHDDGMDRLVAFLVPVHDGAIDRMKLRVSLRDKLPAYMVPSHFELVPALPRLVSGKVDRKALKTLTLAAAAAAEGQEEPKNGTEAALLAAAKSVFGNQNLPLDADFFLDLGGHSLLAARFVSEVRKVPALAALTLQDVYAARSLRAMAVLMVQRTGGVGATTIARDLSFDRPPLLRRFLCGLAQAVALPVIIGIVTAQWLGVFVTYLLISGEGYGPVAEFFTLLGVFLGLSVAAKLIAIAGKWLAIGRTKPGRYPLWGVYYYRWWLSQRFIALAHLRWFQSSPIMRVYLRLLGARVGRDALIADIEAGAIDLVTIGDGASLGGKVKLANVEVVGNELIIGPVSIGAEANLGTSAVIGHDVTIGAQAEILDLTAVPAHTRIGEREIWDGSPARKVGVVDPATLEAPPEASRARRLGMTMLYALALMIIPPISLLPIFPAFMLFDGVDEIISQHTDISYLWYLPALTWPTAFGLIIGTVGLVAVLRWLVLPKVSEGRYSVHSGFFFRKWVVAITTEVTLDTLSSLFATIYMRGWYRIMGAGIGKGSEISSNLSGRYDVTDIGAKNFIADEVVFGDEDIRRGWMTLARTRTGERVFVGNDAVVPPGSQIPDGVLIGIKSKPPADVVMQEGETWFGSPPIKLPTRQKVDGIDSVWTFEPSRRRKLGRAVFEAIHTSIPTMLFITLGMIAVETMMPFIAVRDWGTLVPLFLAFSVGIVLTMTVVIAGIKWAIMGTYRPMMKPMWSFWAMKTEAIAVLYNALAVKTLLEHLQGTPFLPWVLRLFGVKIGKGCWLNMTDLTEFDCVKVGDFCAINAQSALQTHLYEDRVMKVGRVHLGDGVTVGAASTVLYDSHVGDYARLGLLTVVMKGESIPSHSEWHGAPAEPVSAYAQQRVGLVRAA